ncbi:MAG TPA: hypothetical protein VM368_03555, partial [Flavisolibacter sp.]|nr:hypothetical protein [Flavisolibacter sp.]
SLQKIAALPEEERTALLNKMVKKIRKEQGLKEEPVTAGGLNNAPVAPDLFNNSSQRGEWYFYNNSLKTRGAEQFKQIWGTRPNVDGWRRFSTINQQLANNMMNAADVAANSNNPADNVPTSSTLEANLPTTPEALQKSNDSIKSALFTLGAVYLNEANDYLNAINTLEELRRRFPYFDKMDEVLFNLYYAYSKSGNASQAAQVKKLLNDKYGTSRFASIVNTGKDPSAKVSQSPEATIDYEAIYNIFIEGRFAEALEAKRKADAKHQTNYWQPQLLYIEAVYHAKQRDDSAAKLALQTLIAQEQNSPLGKKGQGLLQAISRRTEIENELANYQMQNAAEQLVVQQNPIPQPAPVEKKEVVANVAETPKPIQKVIDTVAKQLIAPPPPIAGFTFKGDAQHFAVVILNKVDPVFINEAKNAFLRFNKEKFYNQPLDVSFANLNADTRLLLIGNFANAQAATEYVQQAKISAKSDIIPWLAADKYSFSVITTPNLEVLQTNQDLNSYKKFIEQHLPGKF